LGSVVELATAIRRFIHGQSRDQRLPDAADRLLVRSAPGLDAAHDLGGEFAVGQELGDECSKDLLSGNAGESEAVGGFSLPDVKGPVRGG
jgi:hypothetical protein